jgi:hypothetical protein
LIEVPFRISATVAIARKGGQTRISGLFSWPMDARKPSASARASPRRPFIFQLPAIRGGLMGT